MPCAQPVNTVAELQKIRLHVIIQFFFHLSPTYPANGIASASVKNNTDPTKPSCWSLSPRSDLIPEITMP